MQHAPRADAAAAGSGDAPPEQQQPELPNPLSVLEGDSIYDYCWFPSMDSSDPATCCFLSTSRDHPVRLWDAYTGQCRGSYVAYNHLDEVTAAHALSFNPSASHIYCGYDRTIRIFDLSRPVRPPLVEVRPVATRVLLRSDLCDLSRAGRDATARCARHALHANPKRGSAGSSRASPSLRTTLAYSLPDPTRALLAYT